MLYTLGVSIPFWVHSRAAWGCRKTMSSTSELINDKTTGMGGLSLKVRKEK